MRRRVRGQCAAKLVGILVVLSVAAGGCGKGGAEDGAAPTSLPQDATPTTTPMDASAPQQAGGAPGAQGAQGEGAKAPDGRATTTSGSVVASQTETTKMPNSEEDASAPQLRMTAELRESCVAPGGTQSIVIRTEPEAGVGYDAVYSDGKSGATIGHYGGNKGGQVDSTGTFKDTWVVAPNAPPGKVSVTVLGGKVGYKHAEVYMHFTVADVSGRCA